MSRLSHVVRAPREDVWSVLADGWLYPLWVVGASRIREVDDRWPSPDSKLHHSFGVWPAVINDHTQVLEADEPRRMVLLARGWPVGEARVELLLGDHTDGTEVTLVERAMSGPGSLTPDVVEDALLRVRNTETLRRLAWVVEGRERSGTHDHHRQKEKR